MTFVERFCLELTPFVRNYYRLPVQTDKHTLSFFNFPSLFQTKTIVVKFPNQNLHLSPCLSRSQLLSKKERFTFE